MAEQVQSNQGGFRRRMVGVVAVAITGAVVTPPCTPALAADTLAANPQRSLAPSEPQLIDDEIADALVLVRGGAVCSGTPITGTRYVVTAAHCVLDRDGQPARRTVVRDGAVHEIKAVWVDTRYADDPSPRFDAAILELDRGLPGASATIGSSLPSRGPVTIAGYQPVDTDDTLLRGENPNDRPSPELTSGHVIEIESLPAGCSTDVSQVDVSTERLDVECGLIPGASGGGLYVEVADEVVLVGIISTVAYDLTSNGVTPLASLAELLDDPGSFRYEVADLATVEVVSVARS